MISYSFGDMWSVKDFKKTKLFAITTNSWLNEDGSLIMGAGIAGEAGRRYPGLPMAAGRYVEEVCGSGGEYGFLVGDNWPKNNIGLFQTKYHFDGLSPLDLIQRSAETMADFILQRKLKEAHLNFPGIGHGKLSEDRVLEVLLEEFHHKEYDVVLWQKEFKRGL